MPWPEVAGGGLCRLPLRISAGGLGGGLGPTSHVSRSRARLGGQAETGKPCTEARPAAWAQWQPLAKGRRPLTLGAWGQLGSLESSDRSWAPFLSRASQRPPGVSPFAPHPLPDLAKRRSVWSSLSLQRQELGLTAWLHPCTVTPRHQREAPSAAPAHPQAPPRPVAWHCRVHCSASFLTPGPPHLVCRPHGDATLLHRPGVSCIRPCTGSATAPSMTSVGGTPS